jgi:cobalt-zinc-cadmium efflux system membrane fusion protein
MRARLACFVFIAFAFFAAAPIVAHEGHDHGELPRTAVPLAPRGEAATEDFQLVAILRNGEVVIYLDRFATNEPVTNAKIEALTPAGQENAVAHEDGSYRLPAKWVDKRDYYDLIFTVTLGEASDVLPVTIVASAASETNPAQGISVWTMIALLLLTGAFAFAGGIYSAKRYPRLMKVKLFAGIALLFAAFISPVQSHDGHDHNDKRPALPGGRDVSQRLPDGSIFVPKSVQRLLAIRTAIAKSGEHSRTIELPGRVIPDANASGYVQSTLAGRLMPPPNGFPALGTKVEKGQILAYVSPPIQAIDVSDMRQKEGEILQQIAILERRVARFEKLVENNTVPRTQLEDARTELQSLKDRKAALEQIRREPEVLVAPVSGVIAEANTIAGQLAQPNTVVFQIVDPSRLWVEALSSEAISGIERASARGQNGKAIKLSFRGSAAALRNQSIVAHFAVDEPQDVWTGQFVTVFASLPQKRSGILLPRAAVVRAANGLHVVFEQVSAERFEPREVKVELLDANHALVTGGLADGKRVVVLGAELIDQVR